MKNTLRHACYNVPHYRRAFDEKGVQRDDFKEHEDIALFPFTDQPGLREDCHFGMFALQKQLVARIHACSATTARATVVGSTPNDIEISATLVARPLRAGRVRPGDRVQVTFGYGLFTGGLGLHYGVEKLGATAIPMSGGQTDKQLEIKRDFEPDAI